MSFLVLQAVILGADAQTPTAIAQLRYEEGIRQYEAGEYEEAMTSFRAALEVRPSPNARLYVARCLRDLGRFAESVSEYHLVVRESEDLSQREPRYAATRQAAEAERAAVAVRVGWLVIRASEPPLGLEIRLGTRDIPSVGLGLPIPVDPGEALIRATAPGYEPVVRSVPIIADQRRIVELEFHSIPDSRSSLDVPARRGDGMRIATFTLLGLTVASGAALVATGALALVRHDELVEACGTEACPSELTQVIDEGETYKLWSNVMIGVTAGLALATLTLAIVMLRRWVRPRRAFSTVRFGTGAIGLEVPW